MSIQSKSEELASVLSDTYNYFNQSLFEGQLPEVLVNCEYLNKRSKTEGVKLHSEFRPHVLQDGSHEIIFDRNTITNMIKDCQFMSLGVNFATTFGSSVCAPLGFHLAPGESCQIGFSVDGDGFDVGEDPVVGMS